MTDKPLFEWTDAAATALLEADEAYERCPIIHGDFDDNGASCLPCRRPTLNAATRVQFASPEDQEKLKKLLQRIYEGDDDCLDYDFIAKILQNGVFMLRGTENE